MVSTNRGTPPTNSPEARREPPRGTAEHEVKEGQSLGGIAVLYKTTVKKLLEINPEIKNPDVIKVGDIIYVPTTRATNHSSRGGGRTTRDPLATPRAHLTDECWEKLESVAKELGIQCVDLLTCILKETWGTFDPAKAGPGSAIGLIQFTTPALEDRERRWNFNKYTRESLAAMSAEEQLTPVRDYLKYRLGNIRPLGADDIYMAILWPAAVGKPDDYILMSTESANPRVVSAYNANKPLDVNEDGKITKAEAAAKVKEYRSMAVALMSERRMTAGRGR